MSEQAKHAAQYTNEAVHSSPWIAIGFGVGVALGALIALAAGASRSRYL